MNKESILNNINVHREKIKKFGVKRIGLFGSFAKAASRDASDIDILVEFRQGQKTFDNYMDLKFFLEDLLGRKVDLVVKEALKSRIKPSVLKEVAYARL